MRPKRRYIAFESSREASVQDVLRVVSSLRASMPGKERKMKLVLYNERSQRGLVRCGHAQLEDVKALLQGGNPSLRVVGVSGTIRAAKRKFLSSAQKG